MTDTTQPLLIAAMKVREAIADLHNGGAEPHPRAIAAAGIAASIQLLPSGTDAERLLRHAFRALALELIGDTLPAASREALAERFPAMRPAPWPVDLKALRDPTFSDGLSPSEHLDRLHGHQPAPAPHAPPLALDKVKALAAQHGIHWPESHPNDVPECVVRQLLAHPVAGPIVQGEVGAPVRGSERPWERPGWCDAEGFCWVHDPLQYDSGWSLVRRSRWVLLHPATELPQPFANDCWLLPAGAIQVPAEDDQP